MNNPNHAEENANSQPVKQKLKTDTLPSPPVSSSSKEVDIQKIILAEHLVGNNVYEALKIANKLFERFSSNKTGKYRGRKFIKW